MSKEENKKTEEFFRTFYVTHRERCGNTITALTSKSNAVMIHFLEMDGRIYESVFSVPEAHRLLNGLVAAISLATRNMSENYEVPEKLTPKMLMDHIFTTAKLVRFEKKEMN